MDHARRLGEIVEQIRSPLSQIDSGSSRLAEEMFDEADVEEESIAALCKKQGLVAVEDEDFDGMYEEHVGRNPADMEPVVFNDSQMGWLLLIPTTLGVSGWRLADS